MDPVVESQCTLVEQRHQDTVMDDINTFVDMLPPLQFNMRRPETLPVEGC